MIIESQGDKALWPACFRRPIRLLVNACILRTLNGPVGFCKAVVTIGLDFATQARGPGLQDVLAQLEQTRMDIV